MATKLDKTIKRELELEGKLYTVTMSPEGVKITPKGARKGQEMTWATLLERRRRAAARPQRLGGRLPRVGPSARLGGIRRPGAESRRYASGWGLVTPTRSWVS